MAVDPKIISQLSADLDNLNVVIDDLSKNISANVNGGLAVTSESIKKIVEGFEKGDDVTKALTKSLDSASLTSRKLGLEQNSLQARLNALVIANNKGYVSGFITKKASLEKQIDENLQQQLLNEKVTDYLNKIGNAVETEKKLTEEKKKQNSLADAYKKKQEELLNTYLSEVAIFKFIIDGALRFNKASVDIGKNLGYGADKANDVAFSLLKSAQNSNNLNVTTANQLEAYGQLIAATGAFTGNVEEAVNTQIVLTKQFKLTAEEAAGIYQYSILTGKSSADVVKNMASVFANTRNTLRSNAAFTVTMAEASKVSGELAANLQNNPDAIIKAVVQAKAFGTSLEQTKAQGDKLLDFESSISSQLKAQLLTGESLNLERARAAALSGDQIALAQELNNQGMTLNKFENMNVLAKRAYAEAIGLTSDQLSDQLKKQQISIEQGKSLSQITAEEALEAGERQNIQERFNAAVLKLQDIFGNIVAGPLGVFLDGLTKALPLVTTLAAIFGTIYAVNKGIVAVETIQAALASANLAKQAAMNVSATEELGVRIGIATAAVIANPFLLIGGIAAAAGIAGLIYNSVKTPAFANGGIVTSEINNATVGEAGPEAIIPLNSPKANAMLGGGSADLTPMIAAINAVKASIDKLYTKEGVVNIDGRKVGTLLTQGSYKLA